MTPCPRSVLALVVSVMALAPACDGDPSDNEGEVRTAPSSEASPVRVGFVPEGYALTLAGRGQGDRYWGDDSLGTDQPFTGWRPKVPMP